MSERERERERERGRGQTNEQASKPRMSRLASRFSRCLLALAMPQQQRLSHQQQFTHSLRVLAFGSGISGQLGLGDLLDAHEPTLVEHLPDDVTSISCGHFHSVAVTEKGEIWTWGRNHEKQLGHCKESFRPSDFNPLVSDTPQRVEAAALKGIDIRQTCASGVATFAIASGRDSTHVDDQIIPYSYSHTHTHTYTDRQTDRQTDRHIEKERKRKRLTILPIVSLLLFLNEFPLTFSCFCVYLSYLDGVAYSWGSSKRGQLGLGLGVTESALPRAISCEFPLKEIACGWGHAVGIANTAKGELMSWGYPVNGRLGYGYSELQQQQASSMDGSSAAAGAASSVDGSAWNSAFEDEEAVAACIWQPKQVCKSTRKSFLFFFNC